MWERPFPAGIGKERQVWAVKTQYENYNFRAPTLALLATANKIIAEFQQAGYDLTLRQLYYQFVARDIIPNTEASYNKLGTVINKGRLAGVVDWKAIVDRTRVPQSNSHWTGPRQILEAAIDGFALDSRATQKEYVEVWVEKDALVAVVRQACEGLDVTCMSCRGYVSQSAMWRAAQRFEEQERRGKNVVLIYLGDHDPSGIDMGHDIQKRCEVFWTDAQVERIALTMEQVDEYNPPPNPAKVTDSRFDSYVQEYGDKCWELDALDPRVITALIEEAVGRHTSDTAREAILQLQEQQRKQLQGLRKKL